MMTSPAIDPHQLNGAALAYIGDGVYELAIRQYMIDKGKVSPNKLHKEAIKFVSADAQAYVMLQWIQNDHLLSSEEINIYKRGRNHKANTKAKNSSIGNYRQATGFEALIGWLYLTQQTQRYQDLIEQAITLIERSRDQ